MNVDVEKKLREIISVQVDVSPEKVTLTATPEELNIDSLAGLELILAFEDAFEIQISDEEANTFKTFGLLLNYVRDATSKK